MDLTTIIGILLSLTLLGFGIATGGGSVLSYVNVASFFIVLGGTFGAVLASHSFERLRNILLVTRMAFRRHESDPAKTILTLLSFSEKARREGLLALEDDIEETSDSFLRMGIQLVVDGTEPEVVKSIMRAELEATNSRHEGHIQVFEDLATLAPAFGLIGTLIGLIVMMSNLGGDPSAIGQGMAAAILTTLYGSVMANCLFTPIAKKLEKNNESELSMKEIIIEGTLSIQSGDNPRILQQKIFSYFDPDIRQSIRDQVGE